MAGLAVSSGRSLFVYGPSGNGKSSLGRQIHSALRGDFWIPYCVAVRNSVIRLFDEQVHQRVEVGGDKAAAIDQRWVRIRRPLVVVGGELTLEYLDLVYSPSLRYYEAPPHLKANGGVFLVDDFGRERVSPHQLLNRFITPMEHQFDYFTLSTGQKIQVPLRQVLIIATNLSLDTVTDPAFLRRMGYRLCLEAPTPEQYAQDLQGLRRAARRDRRPRGARQAAGAVPRAGPGAAGVRAARPDRAGPRHLPLPRAAAGADARGARPGLDRLLRLGPAGVAGECRGRGHPGRWSSHSGRAGHVLSTHAGGRSCATHG